MGSLQYSVGVYTSSDHVSVTLLSQECFYSGNWRSILLVRLYTLVEMSTAKKQTQECPQFNRVCTGTTTEFKVVHVYTGDITSFDRADVIVNAANESLQHAGGVALAIAKKGGLEIQKDSDDYIQKYGTVEVGKAILLEQTGALPPPYKAIVHAVGPQWHPDSDQHKKEIALLKKTCRKQGRRTKF